MSKIELLFRCYAVKIIIISNLNLWHIVLYLSDVLYYMPRIVLLGQKWWTSYSENYRVCDLTGLVEPETGLIRIILFSISPNFDLIPVFVVTKVFVFPLSFLHHLMWICPHLPPFASITINGIFRCVSVYVLCVRRQRSARELLFGSLVNLFYCCDILGV